MAKVPLRFIFWNIPFIALIVTALAAQEVRAQTNPLQPSPTNALEPVARPQLSTSPTEQNDALERELKITETYDGNLLRTVHWTLGTVFTLVILLVGYNWWTSHKLFERDKQQLREIIVNDVKDKLLEVRSEFTDRFQRATASMEQSSLSFKHEVSALATQLNANA
jgi:heme/copper-type cytochrome/quinol oxidase subunit 2